MTRAHSLPPETETALQQLARKKAADFAAREELLAVAQTGSLARGRPWAGSDVDFWAFADDDNSEFEDGIKETDAGRLYWELDVAPYDMLLLRLDEETWLDPPGLLYDDPVTLVEALWGCRIVKDEMGALARVKGAIDSRVGDWRWLRKRAARYLNYGRGCLQGLWYAPPLEAIVLAREVATRYGIAAYWMRAGTLMTSALRIPERLAHRPQLHRLYREIYGLGDQETFAQFLEQFKQLPDEIQQAARPDLIQEVLPVASLGYYDGALRHMRAILPDEYGAEAVLPVLGLGEGDLEKRQRRVLRQVEELLGICGA